MSVVDVWVSPTKAMVIVDTKGQRVDGAGYLEISKMLYLPHANVVIAGRGTNLFLNALFSILHLSPAQSCDDCDRLMFGALKQASEGVKAMVDAGAVPPMAVRNEVTLVGYSDHYHGMHAVSYLECDDGSFEAHEVSDAYFGPWFEIWGPAPTGFPTVGLARAIATEQVSNLLQMHPDKPFGGRLLLAELTREDCRFSTLARMTERTR